MDRSRWMYKIDRNSEEYLTKLSEFIRVAEDDREKKGKLRISCPCKDCNHIQFYTDSNVIKGHLISTGFTERYTCWSWHGELLQERDTVDSDHSEDDDDDSYDSGPDNLDDMLHDLEGDIDDNNHAKFQELFEHAEKPLYAGCKKHTRLSAVLRLFDVKAANGWSDKGFTDLLEAVNELLPEDNELPVSVYKAKKLICPMGLQIKRIHACPNDCVLYTKEKKDLHKCPVCNSSRYKEKTEKEINSDVTKNGPPAKVLWYLPIIPRLKRLFANPKDAKLFRWHAEERKKDGKIRHVADSPQWRNIDNIEIRNVRVGDEVRDIRFGDEIRNVRFGLSSDGINPFGNMSSRHSTWPVLLCVYNLPPWLCMKRKYIMMSLLIQGPKQPVNDIDVYLEPLIDDMRELWGTGVEVYDVYMKETFQLRAMIFCTISDFPACGNLSGYGTKGYKACPVCEDDTHSKWLPNCKKMVYMGHRRSLQKDHPFRRRKKLFDGNPEPGVLRQPLDGEAVLSRVQEVSNVFGKRKRTPPTNIWKKKSIFFDLPYWKHLQVRHCLDVMHIEKNVCDSLIGLLLNIPGKTKDGVNVRKDMVEMGIRQELAPVEKEGSRIYLPAACYTMSKAEKTKFYQCLHGVKVPSGYSSNVKKLVSMNDLKLLGMKSHDCHILITQLIPIAIRGILPNRIRHTITKLCLFFNLIHSKVIDPEVLDEWQSDIILTLCQLEMYFPPSFFDVMVHLVSHIVGEVKACGPVFLQYMYPFERYMGFLKGYVRNRYRPEASIIQGYATEEVIEFCTDYMKDVPNIGIPQSRHEGRLQGVGTIGRNLEVPNQDDLYRAHFTVLEHMTCVAPHIHEHKRMLIAKYRNKTQAWLATEHYRTFPDWLKNKVRSNMLQNVDRTVERLGFGPQFVTRYQGYDINGYTFYTKQQDEKSTLQNSGVMVIAATPDFSMDDHEARSAIAKKSCYGVIQEIWELDYLSFTIPMLKCKWVNNVGGVRVDNYGFTSVNLSTNGYVSEPFILAKQANQIFFVEDPNDSRWHIVLHGKRRIVGVENVVDEDEYDQFDELPPFSISASSSNDVIDDTTYLRSDHDEGT